jgi:hypothetical protein
MANMDEEVLKDYIPAQGPEGLKSVLEDLLEKSKKDPVFAEKEHYIYYQIGEQKSLIKVDMSSNPVTFWYFDLLGRPATRIVKKTIADFLWEKCGEKERFLTESGVKE